MGADVFNLMVRTFNFAPQLARCGFFYCGTIYAILTVYEGGRKHGLVSVRLANIYIYIYMHFFACCNRIIILMRDAELTYQLALEWLS